MAQLVFNKENLRQLKEGLDALLEIFSEVLETGVEQGGYCEKSVKTMAKEKSDLEASLSKAEHRLRQERSLTSQEKLELKNARSSLIFWEGLVKSKSDKIVELQRQQNVQLWEREKERIFAQSDQKYQMEESNKMLRMRRDLTKGALLTGSNEELKRYIYLLEK
ncbi:unnamed protein product, partial [Candidula unifasciata]